MRASTHAAGAAFLLIALLFPVTAAGSEAQARLELGQAWLEALELPVAAHQLRQTGTPAIEVRVALEVMRKDATRGQRGEAPRRSAGVLRAEAEQARGRGPMDGFGAFVRAQVEAGARGQDLARAIREERGGQRREARAEAREEAAQRKAAAPDRTKAAGPATKKRIGAGQAGERRQVGAPSRPAAGPRAGERRPVGAPRQAAEREQGERRPAGARTRPARTTTEEDESGTTKRVPARR